MAYLGNSPLNSLFSVQPITLAQGQTNVVASYPPGRVVWFKNGALLTPGVDITATNGSTATLTNPASGGDVLVGINLASFAVANALPLSGGTLTGPVTGPASATDAVAGLVELATAAEAQGLTDATRVLTPKTLADAFKGPNSLFGPTSGYREDPSGMLVQWGATTINQAQSITLPATYPNACVIALGTALSAVDSSTSSSCFFEMAVRNNGQIWAKAIQADGALGNRAMNWVTIGY